MQILGYELSLRRAAPTQVATEGSQARSRAAWQSPYLSALRQQVPLQADLRLYRMLRETIPCLDSAIFWLTILIGQPEVTADEPLKTEIEEWMRGVRCPPLQVGLTTWLRNHVDSMLWSGKAVGEIVPTNLGRDIYALTNIDPETIVYQARPDSPLDLDVCQTQLSSAVPVVLDAEWLAVNLFQSGTNPHGKSLYYSLPFVSEILLSMEQSLRQTWERFGCPTYRVAWKTPEGYVDPLGTQTASIMSGIETNFTAAMEARKEGQIKDFFATDVEVSVIGAEGETLEFSTPYRSIMEQVVGKTGLPSWMLGFTWSTTERLSTQQADMLTSNLNGMWDELYPDLYRIIELRQRMTGRRGEFTLTRKAVSLQDAVETARARVMEAQADAKREETGRRYWQAGIFDQEQYAGYSLGEDYDGAIATPMDAPPTIAAPANAGALQLRADSARNHRCGMSHKASVQYGGGEQPRDRRIRQAIDSFYTDILDELGTLRREAFRAFGLGDPGRTTREAVPDTDPFDFTDSQMRVLDDAIGRFLETMRGSGGDRTSFVEADGLIQENDRFAHAIGVTRATEMTGVEDAALGSRNDEAIRALMENAFDRLSEGGQMRLDGQLGELRDIIQSGMDEGRNPLDVAREMGERFDQYEQYEFNRLARTEIAFSQNEGQMNEFRAEGVDMSTVESDPPPWHPNCMCGLTIEQKDDGTWVGVYDISDDACELCQAYR